MPWAVKYSALALTLLLMACGGQATTEHDDGREEAASRAVTELASEDSQASLVENDVVESPSHTDWTPVFASWENACEDSAVFKNLQDNLVKFNANPQSAEEDKPTLGKVVLPMPYQQAAGKVKVLDKKDHSVFVIPVSDSRFKGMAVDSIQLYRGHGNGIFGAALVLSEPLTAVQKNIDGIKLLPAKERSEVTDDYQQAYWEKNYDGKVALICDWST